MGRVLFKFLEHKCSEDESFNEESQELDEEHDEEGGEGEHEGDGAAAQDVPGAVNHGGVVKTKQSQKLKVNSI